jgi:hypothetical protein
MTTKFTDAAAAYSKAARTLKNRRGMMEAEAEVLYTHHGGQRAMGFVDGYQLAIHYLTDSAGIQREMAEKARGE